MDLILNKNNEPAKVLITGTTGFVGAKLLERFPEAIASPSLRNWDERQIGDYLAQVQPDVIIHTAAVSDIGESQQYPEISYRANVLLPEMLAKHSGGAKLVFFSSDQVYSGCSHPGPYREDTVCPANLYAEEKLEMEHRVLALDPDAVLLRAEWMYDYVAPKGNYFRNVLGGQRSFSRGQYRGVTYIREVAENMPQVCRMPGGAYNFGSETDKSMFDITTEFLTALGKDHTVTDCPGGHNLWMDCAKARKYGVVFSSVSDALLRCAKDYDLL